jgi:hypothetical protein
LVDDSLARSAAGSARFLHVLAAATTVPAVNDLVVRCFGHGRYFFFGDFFPDFSRAMDEGQKPGQVQY